MINDRVYVWYPGFADQGICIADSFLFQKKIENESKQKILISKSRFLTADWFLFLCTNRGGLRVYDLLVAIEVLDLLGYLGVKLPFLFFAAG